MKPMKPMKPNAIRYETEACSRCGGSGHYSYNQISGTRCFKCGGGKTQLTRRGARARTAVESYKTDLRRKILRIDLIPGDAILINVGGGRHVARRIETVDPKVYSWTPVGEPKKYAVDVTIVVTKPVESGFGPIRSFGGSATGRELIPFNVAEWEAVLDYAQTFKGATVTDAAGSPRILR